MSSSFRASILAQSVCDGLFRVDPARAGGGERNCVRIAGAAENFVNLCLFALSPIPDKLFLKMTRLRTIIGHILKEGEGS